MLSQSPGMSLGNLGSLLLRIDLTSCAVSFEMVHSVLEGRRETYKNTQLWNFRKLKDSCPHTGFTPVMTTRKERTLW